MSFITVVLSSQVKVMLFWGWFMANGKPDGKMRPGCFHLCDSSDEQA